MVIYIEQPAFLPWLGFCEALVKCDTVALYDDVQYSERNVQNRNRLKTASGVSWITAPVASRRRPISEIALAQSFDANKLRRQLQSALGRAPHFTEMMDVVGPALEGHRWLVDLNDASLRSIADALGSSAMIVRSSSVGAAEIAGRVDRIAYVCRAFNETTLWAGSGSRKYLVDGELESRGITPEWHAFERSHPTYPQLWGNQGFVPNLSVVDAAANIGWGGVRSLFDAEADRLPRSDSSGIEQSASLSNS